MGLYKLLIIISNIYFPRALALTPPATPPHQMWKPLPTSSLLVKSKAAETTKQSPSKVIQIEAQPLPSVRSRSKATPAAASVAPDLACMDHDYCLPNKGSPTEEPVKRWNVKQQPVITIKPIQVSTTTQTPSAATAPSVQPVINPVIPVKTQVFPQSDHLEKRANGGPGECSVLETPDASQTRQESESSFKVRSPRRDPSMRSYRRHAASRSPSPRFSPKTRTGGRSRKRRSPRSPSPVSSCSESCSSRSRSRSCSPPKKRFVLLSKLQVNSLVHHFQKYLILFLFLVHCFQSIGINPATQTAAPIVHLVPRLVLPLCPAPLPRGGEETLTPPLARAPGVVPGPGPLKDNLSGKKADDCTGTKHKRCLL